MILILKGKLKNKWMRPLKPGGATDFHITHLGNQVNPGEAQAAHHTQHHYKASAYKTVPFGKKLC